MRQVAFFYETQLSAEEVSQLIIFFFLSNSRSNQRLIQGRVSRMAPAEECSRCFTVAMNIAKLAKRVLRLAELSCGFGLVHALHARSFGNRCQLRE